ncbi:chromosomal replication initiator protein DnaA [Campylobacter blaseri]|uniref:chromosomal replication initiator protein DnaA n=1 Tax=Campylobacter blaseri TaxID=2042961 RepID=UPI001F4D3FDB|nr:chromosomal replication initiator protein DnaA [Campylobacter blaseri]
MQTQVLNELQKVILPNEFNKYIKRINFDDKKSKPDLIIYTTNNEIMAKFIQTKYANKIESIYEEKTGVRPKVLITSKNKILEKNSLQESKEQKNKKPSSTLLIESYNFENFIVGDSNRFAYTCSKFVAQNLGKDYNPLFIYGPSGLGKTHLLQSIGNYCINNQKIVICVTSEQFINDFTFHLRNTSMEKFKNKYRNCDLLLVDDIQFLGKTDKIQEEFFNTFNELKQKGGHIVMTSDKPPKFLKGFEERLLSRFESGIIADIIPPELETKIAIIKRKSQDNKINLDNKIIEYIATNMGDNIREIESALNKINAFSTLMRTEITLEFTKNVLQDQIREKAESVTLEKIIAIISKELNIKPSDIKSKSRTKNIVEARRIGIYLSKKITLNSMPAIASFFGLKDHSAVSHNIKKIKTLIEDDEYLKIKIDELENKILKKEISENM